MTRNTEVKEIPWYTDFATDEERDQYLQTTYGMSLNELLEKGIDPFR